jgi:hypothetical protein
MAMKDNGKRRKPPINFPFPKCIEFSLPESVDEADEMHDHLFHLTNAALSVVAEMQLAEVEECSAGSPTSTLNPNDFDEQLVKDFFTDDNNYAAFSFFQSGLWFYIAARVGMISYTFRVGVLASFALETYLKAFLIAEGVATAHTISSFGHNLCQMASMVQNCAHLKPPKGFRDYCRAAQKWFDARYSIDKKGKRKIISHPTDPDIYGIGITFHKELNKLDRMIGWLVDEVRFPPEVKYQAELFDVMFAADGLGRFALEYWRSYLLAYNEPFAANYARWEADYRVVSQWIKADKR